jgi:adenylate kinase
MPLYKKKIISFLGLPACGKGTQAKLLSRHLHTDSIVGVGVLMREIIRSTEDDDFVKDIKQRYDSGTPQTDETAITLVERYLDKAKNEHILLDNFPFSLAQAKFILKYIEEDHNRFDGLLLIHLKTDPSETIARALRRKICPKCETVYSETDQLICDKCHVGLVVRADDNISVLRERIAHYQPKIAEVLEYLKSNNQNIIEINGDDSISNIALKLRKEVDEYLK